MDTLPFFRRTIEDAGLEDVVVAVIGDSPTVARHWATPLGLVLHRRRPRRTTSPSPTTRRGRRTSSPGGLLVFHDVFEDPADGGQAPFRGVAARRRRRRSTPVSTTGSLRVLRDV